MKTMKPLDFTSINMQKMLIFITAAEKHSFNSAALQLNTSVSTVSKTISALEYEFGIQLFVRKTSGVILTPAGRYLFEKWKEIIIEFSGSIEKALEIQTDMMYSLRIGLMFTLQYEEIYFAIENFKADYRQVPLHFSKMDSGSLIRKFNNDKLDAIFTSEKDLENIDGQDVKWKTIKDGTFCIYVPKSNPLSQRETERISFFDLKKERFIIADDLASPNDANRLCEICKQFGFTPKIETYADSAASVLVQMQFGESIIIAPDYLDVDIKSGIKKYILVELEYEKCRKLVIWHERPDKNPYIRTFVEYILDKK